MTAKEALRKKIDRLTAEQAAEWLARIEWESTGVEEPAGEEKGLVEESHAEYERGDAVDGEELLHELGL
ncbi:MAG TPA: hypothetical protein PKD75_04350 [Tepidiformaceae bacterium]|nr:hypothetical protein [Tepidiformaceae bacterium]